jgi:hypothetical protein
MDNGSGEPGKIRGVPFVDTKEAISAYLKEKNRFSPMNPAELPVIHKAYENDPIVVRMNIIQSQLKQARAESAISFAVSGLALTLSIIAFVKHFIN